MDSGLFFVGKSCGGKFANSSITAAYVLDEIEDDFQVICLSLTESHTRYKDGLGVHAW